MSGGSRPARNASFNPRMFQYPSSKMCKPAAVSSCVFGLAGLQLKLPSEPKEQPAAASQTFSAQAPSPNHPKATSPCLKQKRPRKLSVLLPVEFVEEGCVFQAKRSLKRALVWDRRQEDSCSRDDTVLQPLKRVAL